MQAKEKPQVFESLKYPAGKNKVRGVWEVISKHVSLNGLSWPKLEQFEHKKKKKKDDDEL